ncbi:Chlorophyll a-b binding protein 8, chloroplastic [Hordeum vulgare]|nr:Chlorophyll a-b binding protein 8, chloroplastic [Hordeum vulgare]
MLQTVASMLRHRASMVMAMLKGRAEYCDGVLPGYALLPGSREVPWRLRRPRLPRGAIFNPLGFGTKSEKEMKELKLKEIKNGRLAMLAFLGMSLQAIFTGVGPFQNLLDHLSDPVNNNILTSLKFH